MQSTKKLLALVLVVMMVVSMFSVVNFSSFAEATPDVTVATFDDTNLTDTGIVTADSNATNLYKLTGSGVNSGKPIQKITFDLKVHSGAKFYYWYKDENNYAGFNVNYHWGSVYHYLVVNGSNKVNVRHSSGSAATWTYPMRERYPSTLELNGVDYVDKDFAHCTLEYVHSATAGDHYLLTVETDANTTWGGGKTTKVQIGCGAKVDWNKNSYAVSGGDYNSVLPDMQTKDENGALLYNGGIDRLTDVYFTNAAADCTNGLGTANINNYVRNVAITYQDTSGVELNEDILAFLDKGVDTSLLAEVEELQARYNELSAEVLADVTAYEDFTARVAEINAAIAEAEATAKANEFNAKLEVFLAKGAVASLAEEATALEAEYQALDEAVKAKVALYTDFTTRVTAINALVESGMDVKIATLDESNLTDTGKTISVGDAATNGAPNVYKLTGGGVTAGKPIKKISFEYKIYHGQNAEKNKNMYVYYWYKDENNFAGFNILYNYGRVRHVVCIDGSQTITMRHKGG